MPQRVYIETTIPSAYYNTRSEPEAVACCNWTREWWDEHRHNYEVVCSDAVLDELSEGSHPNQAQKVAMALSIPLVRATPEVFDIVEHYITCHLMPADPNGDALHLALASVHHCDILLTWNCRHLANYKKTGHIRRVNEKLGLHVPVILTPFELLESED